MNIGNLLGSAATLGVGIATGNPMASVSGGVGLLNGLFGDDPEEQAKADREKADEYRKEELKLKEKGFELSEEQYYQQLSAQAEWRQKYGGLESNLLSYVKNLDSSKIYATSEGTMRESFDKARKNTTAYLAARGFETAGGIGAEMFARVADSEARADVELQQKSEQYVMQAQQSLLAGNPMPNTPSTANMTNQLNTMGSTYGQYQNQALQSAGMYQQQADANTSAIYNQLGRATEYWYKQNNGGNPQSVYQQDTVNGYGG